MDSLLLLVADLCGTIGMGFFLFAEIRQLYKVLKTHVVKGISHTAYLSKLIACIFTGTMLFLSSLYLSFAVIVSELAIIGIILLLMKKYKHRNYNFGNSFYGGK